MARVWGLDDECDEGYIDKNGKLIIPLHFKDTWDFSEDYAYVKTKDGKQVFIDKTGQVVLELEFEAYVPYFSEGLVVVKVNGKYGYADKTGALVIEPQFDRADMFSEGLAACQNKWEVWIH